MRPRDPVGHPRLARAGQYARARLASLHPAYFAMSMATGIVSIACHLMGLRELSGVLFWLNVAAYAAIWAAMLARAAIYPAAFFEDWASHQRGPGFFTGVAATGVLGSGFVVILDRPAIAFTLWVLALALWAICTYTIFVAISIKETKPSLADGINGGWLVAVVATQSLVVLGSSVLPDRLDSRDAALFFLVSFWLCGGMLYIWTISLIFYRYTFFRFSPTDLMPPYWINMGAVAISALAGTALIAAGGDSVFLSGILPFVKGFTVLYWATATWWIPMLLALGIWRHVGRRVAFGYDPLYWGLVFPLGMFCVCTYRLVETFGLPFLHGFARGFLVVALVAWLLTFFGLAARFVWIVLLAWRDLERAIAPPLRSASPLDAIGQARTNQPSVGGLS
jgi:tellurite resistance protein TehA-like permease